MKICTCGKEFTGKKEFCSKNCYMRHWRREKGEVLLESRRRYYENDRRRRMKDKVCKLCEIPLITPVYGGKKTSRYCVTCSKNKKLINTLNRRAWRARKRLSTVGQ
jgi:hypothetical protein